MLQQGEKLLWHDKPSNLVLVSWFFTRVLLLSIVLSWILSALSIPIVFGLFLSKGVSGIHALFGLSTIIWLVLFIILLLYHFILIRTYEYYITDQKIILKGGVIIKSLRNIPFHKVTDLEVSQNLIDQILNIYRLKIQTAGTGMRKPEISFIGLKDAKTPENILSNIVSNISKGNVSIVSSE